MVENTTTLEANDTPRQTLCWLVASNPGAVSEEPEQLRSLLKTSCGDYRRELNAIFAAMDAKIPEKLTAAYAGGANSSIVNELTDPFAEECGLRKPWAHWAIESWALALGSLPSEPAVAEETMAAPPEPHSEFVFASPKPSIATQSDIESSQSEPAPSPTKSQPLTLIAIGVAAGLLVGVAGSVIKNHMAQTAPPTASVQTPAPIPTVTPPVTHTAIVQPIPTIAHAPAPALLHPALPPKPVPVAAHAPAPVKPTAVISNAAPRPKPVATPAVAKALVHPLLVPVKPAPITHTATPAKTAAIVPKKAPTVVTHPITVAKKAPVVAHSLKATHGIAIVTHLPTHSIWQPPVRNHARVWHPVRARIARARVSKPNVKAPKKLGAMSQAWYAQYTHEQQAIRAYKASGDLVQAEAAANNARDSRARASFYAKQEQAKPQSTKSQHAKHRRKR